MDNNDKSTALVSVSDLSVVLQGVKRYIDSSKPNVSWDNLANGETIHCDDWHHTMLLGSAYFSGVKIPTKAIAGNVVSLKNLKAESDLVSNGEVLMSKEDLQQMLPNTADITLSDNNLGLYDGCVVGMIEVQDTPFLFLFGEEGGDCVYLSINPVLGSNIETPLLSCDLVQDASLCPQDYVESSLGNANLRDDIKALSEKKPTWGDLANGKTVHCDEFEEYIWDNSDNIDYYGTGLKIKDSWKYGDEIHVRNLRCDGLCTWKYNGNPQERDMSSQMSLPMDFDIILSQNEYSGKISAMWQVSTNVALIGIVGGGLYVIDIMNGSSICLEVVGNIKYGVVTDWTFPLTCDLIETAPCSQEYIESSLGNKTLREDIKALSEKETTWDDLYGGEKHLTNVVKFKASEYAKIALGFSSGTDLISFYGVKLKDSCQVGDVVNIEYFGFGDVVLAMNGSSLPQDWNNQYNGNHKFENLVVGYIKDDNGNDTSVVGCTQVVGSISICLLQGDDGALYVLDSNLLEASVYEVMGAVQIEKLEVICDYIASSPCPPSYVASSIGNESLEEDIKFLKEAIEGDDNESTDTFVAYNYLYLGKARVEGNKLYIDNAEVVDNKIILN